MELLLKSEVILHQKVRNEKIHLEEFNILTFKLSEIPGEEMSFVLSELEDNIELQTRIKKLFHTESAYRKQLNITV